MDYHHRARLIVHRREELAKNVVDGRLSLCEAAAEYMLSRQTVCVSTGKLDPRPHWVICMWRKAQANRLQSAHISKVRAGIRKLLPMHELRFYQRLQLGKTVLATKHGCPTSRRFLARCGVIYFSSRFLLPDLTTAIIGK
jgi:hypothetical protein